MDVRAFLARSWYVAALAVALLGLGVLITSLGHTKPLPSSEEQVRRADLTQDLMSAKRGDLIVFADNGKPAILLTVSGDMIRYQFLNSSPVSVDVRFLLSSSKRVIHPTDPEYGKAVEDLLQKP